MAKQTSDVSLALCNLWFENQCMPLRTYQVADLAQRCSQRPARGLPIITTEIPEDTERGRCSFGDGCEAPILRSRHLLSPLPGERLGEG